MKKQINKYIAYEDTAIPIVCDKVNKTVTVGKYVLDKPEFLNSPSYTVLLANDLQVEWEGAIGLTKDRNIYNNKHLGSKFKNRLYQAIYTVWIDDDKDSAQKICMLRPYNKYCPELLKRYNDNFDEVQQCKQDGIFHIAPLIVLFAKNPKQLKSIFGKSTWKVLANTSLHKNRIMSRAAQAVGECDTDYIKIIKAMCKLKTVTCYSTLLGYKYSIFADNATDNFINVSLAANKYKLSMKTKKEVNKIIFDIIDLIEMCNQLLLPFNHNWSIKRMKSEHDKILKLYIIKQQGLNPEAIFNSGVDIVDAVASVSLPEGMTAEVITTGERLIEEHISMNHCVALYHAKISRGQYYAIHINHWDNRYTLGIVAGGLALSRRISHIDQIQGVNNATCTDVSVKSACLDITNAINIHKASAR